jgi:hypothetical protein
VATPLRCGTGSARFPVDPSVWQRELDLCLSPQARAYALLSGIHFGPDLDRSYHTGSVHQRPHVEFRWTSGIGVPSSVIASDLVALSLLQARLIDLGKPVKVLKGNWCGDTVRSKGAVTPRCPNGHAE